MLNKILQKVNQIHNDLQCLMGRVKPRKPVKINYLYRDEVKDGGDERETLIRLKATSISHYVLISGVWIACMSFYLNPSALMLMNVFIVFFVVSEIVGFVTQLIYYQRGV